MSDKPKKPIFKKWWFWVIAVLVVGAIGSAAGRNDDKPSAASQPPAQTDAAGTETEQAEPSNIFHAGDKVDTKNLSITYQECDADWQDYQYEPREGTRLIRAYFVFENIGNTDQTCGSIYFDCYADGAACDSYLFRCEPSLSFSSISPGRKLEGYVCYEVPIGAEIIELEYETSFWAQDKIIFIVE